MVNNQYTCSNKNNNYEIFSVRIKDSTFFSSFIHSALAGTLSWSRLYWSHVFMGTTCNTPALVHQSIEYLPVHESPCKKVEFVKQ